MNKEKKKKSSQTNTGGAAARVLRLVELMTHPSPHFLFVYNRISILRKEKSCLPRKKLYFY
jgi:hypothetical protein